MKRIKLFENWNNIPQNIVRELEDICLELNDIDIQTECSWFPPLVILGTTSGGYISVGMEKNDIGSSNYIDPINWNEISEIVDRIINYMKIESWYLSSITIDGDTLRQAQANHFINTQSDYEFGGITFNFKKGESNESLKYLKSIHESLYENLPDELYSEIENILGGMRVKAFIADSLVKPDRKVLYIIIGRYENIDAREFTINEFIVDDLRRMADVIEMETEFKYSHSIYFLADMTTKPLMIDETEFKTIEGVNMIQLLFFM